MNKSFLKNVQMCKINKDRQNCLPPHKNLNILFEFLLEFCYEIIQWFQHMKVDMKRIISA